MQWRGRTAWVTGGAKGLGFAIAAALRERGARLVVSGRDAEALARAEAALGARALSCDVRSESEVAALYEAVGPVDILVNNAGVAPTGKLTRLRLTQWQVALDVNATGSFLCTRACLPAMLDRGWGRVINIASVVGVSAGPYLAAYAASKHAVVGLTRAVAAEVEGSGVTANALCPGYIDTEMTRRAVEAARARRGLDEAGALRAVLDSAGQARLLSPDEVAARVVALCEGEDNGAVIVLDGGEACA